MVLNIVFLAGGICIGYLIRGEIQRRKSDKAMKEMIEAGGELVKTVLMALNDTNEEEETSNEGEIVFDGLENLFHTVSDGSNSSDETIKL